MWEVRSMRPKHWVVELWSDSGPRKHLCYAMQAHPLNGALVTLFPSASAAEIVCDQLNIRDYGRVDDVES